VLRRDPQAVTSALDEIVDETGGETDRWLDEAGRRALERSEW
jgi:hypothetical protein